MWSRPCLFVIGDKEGFCFCRPIRSFEILLSRVCAGFVGLVSNHHRSNFEKTVLIGTENRKVSVSYGMKKAERFSKWAKGRNWTKNWNVFKFPQIYYFHRVLAKFKRERIPCSQLRRSQEKMKTKKEEEEREDYRFNDYTTESAQVSLSTSSSFSSSPLCNS